MRFQKTLMISVCVAGMALTGTFPADAVLPSAAQAAVSAEANAEKIEGKVVDKAGPVAGATVMVKGKDLWTTTDIEGNFLLEGVSSGDILSVSCMGYKTKEVKCSDKLLKILLEEDAQLLDGVVVTGFGLAQKKATLTGAITAIDSDVISKSVSANPAGALAGKVAGLNFRQNSGRPGWAATILIRNMGIPLYVVDGSVVDEDQFNNINFNDIESVSVLKDASASIYGVRAANGVVVVNTKKGQKEQKATVGVNAYYGWQSASKFPKPADAVTYLEHYIQSQTVQGSAYLYTKAELKKWKAGKEKGYIPFDWCDYVWNTAPQYYVDANVSGGTKNTTYYFSVGHLGQDAIIRNFGGYQRTNFQLNLRADVTSRLKLGVTASGHYAQTKNPGIPGDDYWLATSATYYNSPLLQPYANGNPLYPQVTSSINKYANFAVMNYETAGKSVQQQRGVQINADLEYEIIKGLSAKTLFSYYYGGTYYDNVEKPFKLYSYDPLTDTYPVAYIKEDSYHERRQYFAQSWSANAQLNFTRKFGEHNVAAVTNFELSRRYAPGLTVYSHPEIVSLPLIQFEDVSSIEDWSTNPQARAGWLGKLNYDYAGKYLAEFSFRYDGSWKFPPGHRWGFFPSGSVGWRLSEENFWKNAGLDKVVNNLKLRASYGIVGDDNLDGYSSFDYVEGYTYGSGGGVIDGKYVVGSSLRGLPVTTLSWIRASILDVGIDLGFFRDRLNISADYFRRRRTGLPAARYDVLIPTEAGFSLPYENLNSDMVQGFDLSAVWNDSVSDFTYSVGANLTYARRYQWDHYKPRFGNSWDEYLNGTERRFDDIYWGYVTDGQFKNWEEIYDCPVDIDGKGNTTLRPGDIRYVDQNGDGVINNMDLRPIGYSPGVNVKNLYGLYVPPSLCFGLNFNAGYKGFDLSVSFAGSAMSTYRPYWENLFPFYSDGVSPQYMMEDSWHLADIWNADSELVPGKYPMLLLGNDTHSNYWDNDFWIIRVKYLKLRNLEFGYTFPQKWMHRAHIQSLRLYVGGQNLFSVSNLPDMDPELSNSSGIACPNPRVFNIGVNLKF